MSDYREILRLSSQSVSQRGIAVNCDCSRNAIADLRKRQIAPTFPNGKAGARVVGGLSLGLTRTSGEGWQTTGGARQTLSGNPSFHLSLPLTLNQRVRGSSP
ncbi:MAG: hypothetical protein DDT20_01281 [Firmicutes bacterium]|nr:hypothetical protein [Bacillota bacterium]